MLRSAFVVSALTLASRVTGLGRDLFMASIFGASAMTDAFNVAFRIPNMLRRLFAEGAFSQAFVPLLARVRAAEGDAAARSLVDDVATALSAVLAVTCVLGVLAAPILVWAMASGLAQSPAGFDAAVFMTRVMFPYIAIMSLVALAAGVLNTYRHFAMPAAAPVLLNMAMILAAWGLVPAFKRWGVEPIFAMSAGVMLGGLLQLGLMWMTLARMKLLPSISLAWRRVVAAVRSEPVRRVGSLMLPALLGVSVAQISLLINTQIASHLQVGSVTWLSYADRLMEFPVAMLGVALGVVLVPQLSAAKAANDSDKYSAMLDWGLRIVIALSVPCAAALVVFAQPLVAVLLHHGAFTAADAQQTALAVMGYGAGLIGLVAIKILAPGYFASQDVKTPALIAVAVLVITQVLNQLLLPHLAHAALTLSIGLGAMVNALWLLIGLLKRGTFKPKPGWGVFVLQVVAATALLAVFLMWAQGHFQWLGAQPDKLQRMGALALIMLGAAGVYLGALLASGLSPRKLLRP